MKKNYYSAPVAELMEAENAWCFLQDSGTSSESLEGLNYQDLGDIWN